MILLHHPESELSRALAASAPAGVQVLDWTDKVAVATYAGPQPSAFPSVVVDVPAYSVPVPIYNEAGAFVGMGPHDVPATQEALHMPANWAVVDEYAAYVAQRVQQSPPQA